MNRSMNGSAEDMGVDRVRLIKLAASDHARKIFLYIADAQKRSPNVPVYYNQLCRELGMPKPTVNRYLSAMLKARLIEANWSRIRSAEAYEIDKTNVEVKRVRRIWARVVNIASTEEAREFERIISGK